MVRSGAVERVTSQNGSEYSEYTEYSEYSEYVEIELVKTDQNGLKPEWQIRKVAEVAKKNHRFQTLPQPLASFL